MLAVLRLNFGAQGILSRKARTSLGPRLRFTVYGLRFAVCGLGFRV